MARMRIIRCPFCNEQNIARWNINVLCSCGAKFYIHNYEWWDRKNGKVLKVTAPKCTDCARCTYVHEYETYWCGQEQSPVGTNDTACESFEWYKEE